MAADFIYKHDNPDIFWRGWETLVARAKAGPSYTRLNLEWCFAISKARSLLRDDKSFIYLFDKKPLAAVLLPFEKVAGRIQASLVGGYIYAPLIVNPESAKTVFAHIDTLVRAAGGVVAKFAIDSLAHAPYNFLQRFGYLDATILDYHIATTGTPAELLKACRHGHHSDIKTMLTDPHISTFVMDKENADYALHEEYRALHRKCAGRETRPKETFDIQFKKVENGEALMCAVKFDTKVIAAAYFEYANGQAVYASGADDPDFVGRPLYHLLIYTAMVELQRRRVTQLSVGQPANPGAQFDHYPDEKQLRIAHFKRGFGGTFASSFRGIKYYDIAAFDEDVVAFKNSYQISATGK